MKVLVCGGRNYADRARVWAVLDFMAQEAAALPVSEFIEAVIHGGAGGADFLAGEWAASRNVTSIRYPADWNKHGRAAGPIRNQQMIDEGKPDCVVAFPGGRGTQDMIRRAKVAGIPVQVMKDRPAQEPGPAQKEEPE